MAKGRKHGLNPHERLLGSFSYSHGVQSAAADLPDLGEEDVWSAVGGDVEGGGGEGWFGGATGWTGPAAAAEAEDGGSRDSAGEDRRCHVGGLSLALDGAGSGTPRVIHRCRNADNPSSWREDRRRHVASSAPVSVPGWPGLHRVDSDESPPAHADYDGEDEDGGWMPPHEYLAREYGGRTTEATSSVFEGVGRTLKGRDMRRLRDAVWSRTGFDG